MGDRSKAKYLLEVVIKAYQKFLELLLFSKMLLFRLLTGTVTVVGRRSARPHIWGENIMLIFPGNVNSNEKKELTAATAGRALVKTQEGMTAPPG